MVLAQNETVVKSWRYAQTKQGRERTESTLTLTDKRLVSTVKGNHDFSQTEVPLNCICGSSVYVGRKGKLLPILMIILGIPLVILGIGIVLIKNAVDMLKAGEFQLEIETEGLPIDFGGVSSFVKAKNRHKLRVKVDMKAANEIAETLSSLIMNKRAEQEAKYAARI